MQPVSMSFATGAGSTPWVSSCRQARIFTGAPRFEGDAFRPVRKAVNAVRNTEPFYRFMVSIIPAYLTGGTLSYLLFGDALLVGGVMGMALWMGYGGFEILRMNGARKKARSRQYTAGAGQYRAPVGIAPGGKDYYRTLEVPARATEEDIKRAYRKLARRYHPDLNPGNKTAEARFKEVNEAYEVLSDKNQRAVYDQQGYAGVVAYQKRKASQAVRWVMRWVPSSAGVEDSSV